MYYKEYIFCHKGVAIQRKGTEILEPGSLERNYLPHFLKKLRD